MGFSRPRYNEKARSHRSNQQPQTELDSNQNDNTTDPTTNNPGTEKMSKKKQKRFESYLAKKLKKDQHNQLLKDIEASQSTVLDPSALVSTANLNSASVARTQREIKEVEAKIESRKRERAQLIISNKKRKHQTFHSDDEDQEEEDEEEEKHQVKKTYNQKPCKVSADQIIPNSFSGALTIESNQVSKNSGSHTSDPSRASALPVKPTLGSALAPNAVTRVVSKRKPKTAGWKKSKKAMNDNVIESDEDSFNSSDSAYDSSSDDEETKSKSSDEQDPQDDEEEEWTGCQFGVNDEDEESLDEEMKESDLNEGRSERVKGSFRDWANAQLLQVDDHQSEEPTLNQDDEPPPTLISTQPNPRPKHSDTKCGPLGAPLDLPETDLFLHQKTINVPLTRSEEIKASRSLLPIFAEEHTVMDAIRRHPVVVICGETGSGKTTQLPQFLYEAGWGKEDGDNPGMIGITQPRRVAAVSMASRVENEMGLKGKGVVAFQIRYEATTEKQTRLKFMTDGVLLRELAADFLLTKYSVIIVDEAHERSVNTDVLIGVLSRIVRLRLKMWREQLNKPKENTQTNQVTPLRLIIMSATLRVTDFTLNTTLFSEPPPVITIAARQFPVSVHFNRKTNGDYITEAYKKASKVHTRLPPGGILIFLTGQLEIMNLCKKLSTKYGKKAIEERKKRQSKSFIKLESRRPYTKGNDETIIKESELNTDTVEVEDIQLGKDTHDLAADVDEGHEAEDDPEALDTEDEDDMDENGLDLMEDSDVPMYILPLYSLLPTEEQMKVFEDPPEDSRLVVIATNVAETSLTIPNIRYVIDSGRAKERHYDLSSGIQSFEIDWISKASASQRSGRAGRTGPGHCYRLYSSAVFENYFQDYSKPEIQRMPIDGIVLQMKSMNIDTVTNFPFPTPPDRYSLRKAEVGLAHLGALTFQKGFDHWCLDGEKVMEARITELGRVMAQYPLTPRFARMLVSGSQHGCLPYVIALVSILSVGDPFLHEDVITSEDGGSDDEQLGAEIHEMTNEELKLKEIRKSKRKRFYQVQQQYSRLGEGMSDLFKSLSVVGAYEFNRSGSSKFCEDNFLRLKAMEEIHKLRKQITKIVQKNQVGEGLIEFLSDLRPPNELQLKVLRQLITASFIDQVAIKTSLLPNSSTFNKTHQNKNHLIAYRTIGIKEDVFIHPSSILFTSSSINSPEFIVFQELIKTKNRIWIKGITKVNQAWLPVIGKSLCTFKTLEGIKPLQRIQEDQKEDETQRVCFVQPRFGGPGLDFELSPIEVFQKKVGNRWVFV